MRYYALALATASCLRISPPPRTRAFIQCAIDDDDSYKTIESTSSPIKALVSSLTNLVGGDVSNEAVETEPRPGLVTPEQLLDGIRDDYVERLYLWTGDIDAELYDDDCTFTDPTLSFRGLATFQKNLAALQPFLSALVKSPSIDLYSCELDEPSNRLEASWRMVGDLNLPWRPCIDLKGRTKFRYSPERNGRIVAYEEEWELDAGKALLQLITPKGSDEEPPPSPPPLPSPSSPASSPPPPPSTPSSPPPPSASAWPTTPLDTLSHLPLLALPSAISFAALPLLYSSYQAAAPADNLVPLLSLLLAKRLTLYACALSAVYVAAMRSSDAPPGLGQRLEVITADAVRPLSLPEEQTAEVKAVTTQLDQTPESAQAAGLPILFGVLLFGAYVTNVLLATPPPPEEMIEPAFIDELLESLRGGITSVFQPLSTASVCLFAVNAESQAMAMAASGGPQQPSPAPNDDQAMSPASIAAAAAALTCVATAYLLPSEASWPIQNGVNACIAIGVARVLQLPNLSALLAALLGLALYDGFGTLFFAAGPAMAAGGPDDFGAAQSVMEGVAQAKLSAATGSGVWQPGLLTVRLEGRLTDALGLGDIVAPSMLAGWARRFDLKRMAEDGDAAGGYLGAALSGYALGCVLLEVAPPELTRAALLFLLPCSAAAVVGRLVLRGDVVKAFA